MMAAVTFSWRFILSPFCLASHRSLATQVVSVGYPLGDLILLLCLLMTVADAFSAMTMAQPYRKGMDEGRARSWRRGRDLVGPRLRPCLPAGAAGRAAAH